MSNSNEILDSCCLSTQHQSKVPHRVAHTAVTCSCTIDIPVFSLFLQHHNNFGPGATSQLTNHIT